MNHRPYEIKQLFYPAMIGGVISITVLGIRNARTLKLDSKIINFLAFLGILILLGEIIVVSFLAEEHNLMASQMFISLFRTLPILLYFLFYVVTKKAFVAAKESGLTPIPLGKEGLIWTLVGLLGEIVIVFLGSQWTKMWV